MVNLHETTDLPEPDSQRGKRVSDRQAERGTKRPCYRDDQAAPAVSCPRKRTRTSGARPSNPNRGLRILSCVAALHQDLDTLPCVAAFHQDLYILSCVAGLHQDLSSYPDRHAVPADCRPRMKTRTSPSTVPKPRFPIPSVAPSPRPSTAPLLQDGPLVIHQRSVEQYQQLYHEVVDDMLKFKDGRRRPYSLVLGRRIKLKLWEVPNLPLVTSSDREDGRVEVIESYEGGVSPAHYDVDVSDEPKPQNPAKEWRLPGS